MSENDLLLGLLQIYDVFLNVNQVSNDRLLKELQNQNETYLKKILEQNETILKNQKEILARLTAY